MNCNPVHCFTAPFIEDIDQAPGFALFNGLDNIMLHLSRMVQIQCGGLRVLVLDLGPSGMWTD
jgi:hypothetical protein